MNSLLHDVTGKAEWCGPCALSALTGKSADSWPDEKMTTDEVVDYLKREELSVTKIPGMEDVEFRPCLCCRQNW
ncbi:MAG: hypothetical protein OXG06_06385 [Gammaproteobacteria bacterium]|nr:hypothetical protein [Gammaproteobacteria bacterium]